MVAVSLVTKPCTLWLTGKAVYVIDGDHVRQGLNKDLGFSIEDRSENIRRVAEVAKLMNEAGLIVICALISPISNDRELAKNIIGENSFLEIHIATSLAECEKRDPKGLYQRARSGELKNFTGITSPYETPSNPSMKIDAAQSTVNECVLQIKQKIGTVDSLTL
jgi:adenylylsulfate kinase